MSIPVITVTKAIGGFGGPVDPDGPVGTFAGTRLGSLSVGTWAGKPAQRIGSFADRDL